MSSNIPCRNAMGPLLHRFEMPYNIPCRNIPGTFRECLEMPADIPCRNGIDRPQSTGCGIANRVYFQRKDIYPLKLYGIFSDPYFLSLSSPCTVGHGIFHNLRSNTRPYGIFHYPCNGRNIPIPPISISGISSSFAM